MFVVYLIWSHVLTLRIVTVLKHQVDVHVASELIVVVTGFIGEIPIMTRLPDRSLTYNVR